MAAENRIGASLAALREDAGITRRDLADLADTPLATIADIERGGLQPPAWLVARLAAAIASRLRGDR